MSDPVLPEVIVTGARSAPVRRPSFVPGFGRMEQFDDREEQQEPDDRGRDDEEPKKKKPGILAAIGIAAREIQTRIVASAEAGSALFKQLLAQEQSDFARLMAQESRRGIPEAAARATATASRLSSLNAASVAAAVFGELYAAILEDVSMRRLNDAGRLATRTDFQRTRDTRVRTQFQDRPMDEITVSGSRPFPKDVVVPRTRTDQFFEDFGIPDGNDFSAPLVDFDARPGISKPKLKTQPEKAGPRIPRPTLIDFFQPDFSFRPRTQTERFPDPPANTRPTIQNFFEPETRPQPKTKTQPDLTGGNDDMVDFELPQSVPGQQFQLSKQPDRASFCPPCQKGTEATEMRDKCYRQLVKQKRNPADDVKFNWEEIDCITGRKIPKIIQTLRKF